MTCQPSSSSSFRSGLFAFLAAMFLVHESRTEEVEERLPDLQVIYEGNTTYSDRDLSRVLEEQKTGIRRFGLTRPRADDTAFFLNLYYLRHGFPNADVRWEIEPPSTLILQIEEGPEVVLGQIDFVGNTEFPHQTLYDFMVGRTRERFTFIRATLPFVLDDLRIGAGRIRSLYLDQGYLDVTVDEPQVELVQDGRRANVSVTIEQGSQYQFGSLELEGDLVFSREEIEDQLADVLERPFSRSRLITLRRRLQSFYENQGYYQANVSVNAFQAEAVDRNIPVHLRVEPGELFEVAGVQFEGERRLRKTFLERRFERLEGERYDPESIDAVFQRLMRSGLFSDLRISPDPISDDEMILDVQLEEARARELGLSVGYGTFEGFIFGVQTRDRNLFGYGRPVTLGFDISQRTMRAELSYEDPWLFDDYRLRVSLLAQTLRFDGYSILEFGIQGELNRQFTRHYSAGLVAATFYNSLYDIDIEPQFVGPTDYLVNSIGFVQTLDYRDSPIAPTSGWVVGTSLEYASQAIGSEIDFIRGVFRASVYHRLGNGVLGAGIRGGVIQPIGGTSQLPIDERFFTGGANTVRSFAERELGPKDRNNYPIGGQATLILNLEYDYRIIGDLGMAAFVDAGNLQRRAGDFGFGDMRYGVGLGLRYYLPIGPIRVDYGINPDRREDEAFGALHISFGFAF